MLFDIKTANKKDIEDYLLNDLEFEKSNLLEMLTYNNKDLTQLILVLTGADDVHPDDVEKFRETLKSITNTNNFDEAYERAMSILG